MRPVPWSPRPVPTIWLSWPEGTGVTDDGTPVKARVTGRRVRPSLADLLDTAHAHGARRIMLTGAVPEPEPGRPHWLITNTPGWKVAGHWLGTPPTGRFRLDVERSDAPTVEVRTVKEWFGGVRLTPDEARQAWDVTGAALAQAVPGATMWLSPAATGANTWALSLPRGIELDPLDDDLAALIHRTSGQHRIEHMVTGPSRCACQDCISHAATGRAGGFVYTDGRFMYSALVRELGAGNARMLTGEQAADLLHENPYARARVHVRFTVPDDWSHVGILGVQLADTGRGWHWPNRPGAQGETWADAAEVHVARQHGWHVQPIEAVAWDKARVLDTWATRLVKARGAVTDWPDLDPPVRRAASGAMRMILLTGIGAFASRGRGHTVVVASARDVPAEATHTIVRHGDVWTYVHEDPHDARARAYYQPHLAAQVWGRERARLLSSPTATTRTNGAVAGALAVPAAELIGVYGDALYTTSVPQWALPTEYGGGDDGAVGRLRLQGVLPGPITVPTTTTARNKLRAEADAMGRGPFLASLTPAVTA